MVSKFFVIGGYRGMKEKYGKRVSPRFNTYEEALHYKQTYGVFSLSLSDGTIKSYKRGSIRQGIKSLLRFRWRFNRTNAKH